MSRREMHNKVHRLRELRREAAEISAEIEAITDELKGLMSAQDADELTGDDFKITWRSITTNRFDSSALKAASPELYARFTVQSTARRFCLL